VADPVVVLLAPAASHGAILRDRLVSLGFRCELIDSSGPPRGWRSAEGDVVLVMEQGGFSGTASILIGRRAGTPLEGLPIVILGQAPPLSASELAEVDETLEAGVSDRALTVCLRHWTRWGGKVRRLREMEQILREGQSSDALTGLPGHRAFHERLEMEVKRSERYESPLGLILCDVVDMRGLNDRIGHRSGDRLLHELAAALRRAVRDVDTVARYEGNTFGVILPESGPETTIKVMERLRTLVSSLIFRGEASEKGPQPLLKITMRFGHASLPDAGIRGKSALMAAAEAALAAERSPRTAPAPTG
jgi:diguanylate cyclase (GGDEF)-like protein